MRDEDSNEDEKSKPEKSSESFVEDSAGGKPYTHIMTYFIFWEVSK